MPSLPAQINPLAFPELDWPNPEDQAPTGEKLLDYLLAPGIGPSRDAVIARYREVAAVEDSFPASPAEPVILNKLVWPLRYAKGSYALGNYVGCIALCGFIGEMVAVFISEIAIADLQGKSLTKEEKKQLGRAFEKLRQDERVKLLRRFKLIDDRTKRLFDNLRTIRRRYLHLLSEPDGSIADEARQAYGDAVRVVALVLAPTFKDGKAIFRNDLMIYLVKKGIASGDS